MEEVDFPAKGDVTGVSRTCRGRHWKVGIVEFGLKQASTCLVDFF